VSSPPAQEGGRVVKIRAEQGDGSAKQIFSAEKWLANMCDGTIIAKMIEKLN
jgi:hypothetical protein